MSQPRRKVIRHGAEYQKFVSHLREVREQAGKTQEEVADGINLSRSQYTAIESGRSMVNFDHLCSLAKFYKDTVSGLLEGVV